MKSNGWISALFGLVFLAVPGLAIFFFLLPITIIHQHYLYIFLIGLGFGIFSIGLTFGLIHWQILSIDSVAFNFPLSLIFTGLIWSEPLPWWGTAIIVLSTILSAIPANILATKWKRKRLLQIKQKLEQKRKIIK